MATPESLIVAFSTLRSELLWPLELGMPIEYIGVRGPPLPYT